MKNLVIVLALVFCLVSCKEISGALTVHETFSALVNKKCGWSPFSSCDPNKKLEIPSGYYISTIDFGSKTEIKIEMKANAFKETIILKRPKTFEFPANGPFQLSRAQVNQAFDVDGNVKTTVWDSNLFKDNESCTYTVPDYVCYPDNSGRPQCSYQNRTVWGYRFVEYFNRNTTKELQAKLVDGGKTLAQFNGNRTDAEKIYTFTSICR